MNASVQTNQVPVPFLVRWSARAAGAVVIVTWLELVLFEWVRQGPPDLRTFHQVAQAATLAIVFAGYLIGWRNELVGGLLSVIGTVAFAVVCALTMASPPAVSSAWFAAPGLLFLFAWYVDHRQGRLIL